MNWILTDIFKNKDEFENTKKELLKNLEKIENMQGKITQSIETLYECYKMQEIALEQFEKIYAYGMLNYHLDMSNQESIKLFKDVEQISTVFITKTSFIEPEITYADESLIKEYVNDKRLEPYKIDINKILERKKHTLSKESENLLANYSEIFSSSENTYDILTNTEFKFGKLINEDGKEVELTDSNYTIYLRSKSEAVRKQAFHLMYQKYGEFINTIAQMYLTNVKTNSITSKLRNYKSGLEKAVVGDDATIKVYDALIDSIDDNICANHEFLKLKKKLLKKENMHLYDIYVNPFEAKKDEITFEDAKEEVLEALNVLGEDYINKLQEAFDNHWIDVYAKPNKKGGAYSMGVYHVHPFVLLNFVNSKRDVSTIAHELGHSMHSYYSSLNQNIINSNYTIMVAEVASTVNELLLAHFQIENEKNKLKKAEILYELLEMIRATFFRQAMFAEFEKKVHEKIENEIPLSSEDLNYMYYKLNEKYFGKEIEIDKEIQYEWARIPHFYSNFYVYKYATRCFCRYYNCYKYFKKR